MYTVYKYICTWKRGCCGVPKPCLPIGYSGALSLCRLSWPWQKRRRSASQILAAVTPRAPETLNVRVHHSVLVWDRRGYRPHCRIAVRGHRDRDPTEQIQPAVSRVVRSLKNKKWDPHKRTPKQDPQFIETSNLPISTLNLPCINP